MVCLIAHADRNRPAGKIKGRLMAPFFLPVRLMSSQFEIDTLSQELPTLPNRPKSEFPPFSGWKRPMMSLRRQQRTSLPFSAL